MVKNGEEFKSVILVKDKFFIFVFVLGMFDVIL